MENKKLQSGAVSEKTPSSDEYSDLGKEFIICEFCL